MTAAEMRERLMAVLSRADWVAQFPDEIADALLPVVRKIVGDELRAVAADYRRGLGTVAPIVPMSLSQFAPWLCDRADEMESGRNFSPCSELCPGCYKCLSPSELRRRHA